MTFPASASKYITLALSLAAAELLFGCDCPESESGIAVESAKYAAERDAVCSVVPGCATDYMAAIRVYEAPLAEVREQCPGALACYCPRMHCSSILLGEMPIFVMRRNMVHEYCHAAMDTVGIDTHDHPPAFEACVRDAKRLLPTVW